MCIKISYEYEVVIHVKGTSQDNVIKSIFKKISVTITQTQPNQTVDTYHPTVQSTTNLQQLTASIPNRKLVQLEFQNFMQFH